MQSSERIGQVDAWRLLDLSAHGDFRLMEREDEASDGEESGDDAPEVPQPEEERTVPKRFRAPPASPQPTPKRTATPRRSVTVDWPTSAFGLAGRGLSSANLLGRDPIGSLIPKYSGIMD